jgi:hypothetical protein
MSPIENLVAKSQGELKTYICLPAPWMVKRKKWTHQIDWTDEEGCECMLRLHSLEEAERFAQLRLKGVEWIIRSIPSIN